MRRRVSGLRAALCALCRVLSASGSHWDPEMLRKSKFDRPEATPEFWNLLYSLLWQIFPCQPDSSPSAQEKIVMADRVRYVKSALLIQGYGRRGFYALADDGAGGSREMLLALSWLLHRVRILEILLEKKRVNVGDQITICLCPHDESFQECKDTSSSTNRNVDVRLLQWMNGKLRFCWRALQAAHLEECALLYKIHSYTHGCHIDKTASHLSVMETELVRRPASCDQLLQELECEISYLEAYTEWKRAESVYWQWMDTVVESACADERSLPMQNMSTICRFVTSGSHPQYIPTDVKVLSECLRDTQDQLHQLAALWNSASQQQMDEIDDAELGEKELKKIQQEVKKKMERCKPVGGGAKEIHGSCRLLLKEPTRHKPVDKDGSRNDVHVSQVTRCLQSAVREMETEYCGLQDQCRKRMEDIIEELDGIICIPPAKG